MQKRTSDAFSLKTTPISLNKIELTETELLFVAKSEETSGTLALAVPFIIIDSIPAFLTRQTVFVIAAI